MKRTARLTTIALLFGCLLVSATTVMAHHSFSSEFDINKPIRIEGKVTQVTWANPHGYVDVAVSSNSENPLVWRIELPAPNHLMRADMHRDTVTVGSVVAVAGYAAKSGERLIGTTALTVKATGWSVAIPIEGSWSYVYPAPAVEHFYGGDSVHMTGKVVDVDRVNPVPTVRILVTAAREPTQEWIVQTVPTTTLDQIGWTAASLVPGDVIQIDGQAAKSGSKKAFATKVLVIEKGGKALNPPLALLNSAQLVD